MTSSLDGVAPLLGAGELAQLTGDERGARAAFERVLATADASPVVIARAAVHLAELELRAGKGRHVILDLIARATTLASADPEVDRGVAALEAELVAASSEGELRGPRIGTALPGGDAASAAAFADAERALGAVHAMRLRPLIEALSSSIRAKEDATEDAVQRYRTLATRGGALAIAANYRIGSLYHDLALALLFELPSELDPSVAAGLRRTLRGRALGYLDRAVTAYRASLALPAVPETEIWQLAAATDLRGARDVLGEAGVVHTL